MLSNKLVVGIFAWSASVCAQAVPTSIPTDKPVAFSSGLNVLDTSNGGLNSLPKPSYTIKQWPWGTLPKNCYDLAVNPNEGRCAPTDVEVYDVTYSDCSVPWQICRCKNAQTDITSLVESVARVPVKTRQLIRHWSAWPGNGYAKSFDNNVWVVGDQRSTLSVYIHEALHTLDSWYVGNNGATYSVTRDGEWARAVAADSCVADPYARASFAEAFAQCGVMATYDLNVASINNFPISCMRNQYDLCKRKLSDVLTYNPNDKCDPAKRWPNTPAVCMSEEARNQGRCNGVPNAKRSFRGRSLTDLDITGSTIPCVGVDSVYSYGNSTV